MPLTINCDMGEAFGAFKCGDDEGIMPFTSLANVACGFHASDPTVMHKTVRLAKAHGVAVGAHPSLPDLQGFGRREMKIGKDELTDCIIYQVGALKAFLDLEGLPLSHIKPHGALFGMAIRDHTIAEAIANAVAAFAVPILGMAGTLHETVYTAKGLDFIAEYYIDLDYSDEGMLIITRDHDARDPAEAARRAIRVAQEGMATSTSGKSFPIRAESYCIHSDTPNAVALAKTVTKALAPWLNA